MSIAIRPKRQNAPVIESPRPIRHRESEAPEQGFREREAPEMVQRDRTTRSPEAGEGRAGLYEHEFTHGRSQS